MAVRSRPGSLRFRAGGIEYEPGPRRLARPSPVSQAEILKKKSEPTSLLAKGGSWSLAGQHLVDQCLATGQVCFASHLREQFG